MITRPISLNDAHTKYISPAGTYASELLMCTGKLVKSQEPHIYQCVVLLTLRLQLSMVNTCLEKPLDSDNRTTSSLRHILSWHTTQALNPLKCTESVSYTVSLSVRVHKTNKRVTKHDETSPTTSSVSSEQKANILETFSASNISDSGRRESL
jgi:hypothetical protein